MAKAEKSNQFIAIRSMFVTGSVRRLRDIEKLYPTAMAKALGINHSRYIHKLYHPEEFSIKHLLLMASTLDLDVHLLIEVVLKQSGSVQKLPRKS